MVSIDYGSLLKRSWEITKKNKWLWIYGVVLVMFAGGYSGGGGGGSGGGNSFNLPGGKDLQQPREFPQKAADVLGQATTVLKQWVTAVPATTWIILGLGVAIIIFIWIIIVWVIRSWATAGLILGVADADKGQPVTLLSTSSRAITKIKHLLIFGLISMGLTIGIVLGTFLVALIVWLVLGFMPVLQIVWLILSLITGILGIVVGILLLIMLSIYAERLIVLHNFTPWQAWKRGLSLSKHNFLSTLVMGIINQAVGCSVGCLVLFVLIVLFGIPAIIILWPSFQNGLHFPGLGAIFSLGILFILFIYANSLINGILLVFKFSNWNLFMKAIMEAENQINKQNQVN